MYNKLLANAIVCYRFGKTQPITMSPGTTGELYIEISENLIQERLPAAAHQVYVNVRDVSRVGVRLANQAEFDAAQVSFRQASETLDAQAESEELRLLGVSRVAQAEAYLTSLTGAWDRAQALIYKALDNDEILETQYGYTLFHIQRIHLLHLLLRVEIGAGRPFQAVITADQILQYLNGSLERLPIGGHWGQERVDAVPVAFRNGMLARTTSEVGILLAKQSVAEARRLWSAFPSWSGFDQHAAVSEIYDWGRVKEAFLQEDTSAFLERAASFLAAGRRETLLWYTTVLDLCTCCQALRPAQTRGFRQEVAQDAVHMSVLPSPLLPSNLRRMLQHNGDCPTGLSPSNGLSRRFHAYNVGLPRTGTSSIATLFGQYRSVTEFKEQETVEHIVAWQGGGLSAEAFRDYVLRRDGEGQLEMDSASFNHFYLDILVDMFPQAKFVFTMRDCYSWINSFLSLLLRWRQRFLTRGLEMPAWMTDYGRLLFGDFSWAGFASSEALRASVPDLVEPFIRCWSIYNLRVLERLPPERSLIIRTHDLSHRLDELATFIGVPRTSLTRVDHMGINPDPVDWLCQMDRTAFDACCARYGSEVTLGGLWGLNSTTSTNFS